MTEPTVRFDLWNEPLEGSCSFSAHSAYVEQVWASAIGPTALLALRSAVRLASSNGGTATVGLPDFARSLGLGAGTGRNAPVSRSLARLETFGLALGFPGGLAVRAQLPPLRYRQLMRAPRPVQLLHERYLAERAGTAPLAS